MNILGIINRFPTEESCIAFFRELKEANGIICRACGSTEHYWNRVYKSHDCKKCFYRTTLRSGTIMESSKLPFRYWLYSIFSISESKKTVSALELQRTLGHKRYEPIWLMSHKINASIQAHRVSDQSLIDIELAQAIFMKYESRPAVADRLS